MANSRVTLPNWVEIAELTGSEVFAVDDGGATERKSTTLNMGRFSSGFQSAPAILLPGNTAVQNATAIAAAITTLGSTKGIVLLPAGSFELEGALWPEGIYFSGAGIGEDGTSGTTLNLPASPTNHMFLGTQAQVTGNWQGGGFTGIRAMGGQTYVYSEYVAEPTGDTFDLASHPLSNNDVIHITSQYGISTGLEERTDYHVINSGADDFQISLSQGGAAVNFSTAGLGKQYFYKVDGFDFINLSDFDGAAGGARLESLRIEKNHFEGFRYVFGNTAGIDDLRDREVNWDGNRFLNNVAAIYTNEHPRLLGRNDFRGNIFAICGNIFDCAFNNQNFVRNVFDIWPLGAGSTSMGRSTFVGNLVIFPVNGLKISSNRFTITANIFAAATSPDTTTEQFIILFTNGYDGTINSNTLEELSTSQKCNNAHIMLETFTGTFSRASIKTNTFTVYGLAVGFASNAGNIDTLGLDDNTFRMQQGQIIVYDDSGGTHRACSFNGNTVHAVSGYTDNLDLIVLASKSGRGYQLNNNKFKAENSLVIGTDLGSFVSGEFEGTTYMGNIHYGGRVTISAVDSNTVPNAATAGFSDDTTDTAGLKTLNVFYAA